MESESILSQLEMLRLIGEENRLKLLCILRNGEHCVSELIEHTNVSQSLTSHHLADLRAANIVRDTKRGREVYYTLTERGGQILQLLQALSI
jgi:DNA-binding transcriptional ArsR family regulator